MKAIADGQLPGSIDRHEECSTFFPVHVLRQCWSREPSDRPLAKKFADLWQYALFHREESNRLLEMHLVMSNLFVLEFY